MSALAAVGSMAEVVLADSGSFGVLGEIPLPSDGVSIDTLMKPNLHRTDTVLMSQPARSQFTPTPQQVEEAKHPKQSVYVVDSAKYANGDAGINSVLSDPVTSYECEQVYSNGYREEFWAKNRFAKCQFALLVYTYYAVKGGPPTGQATAKATIVLNMQPDTREIQVAVQLFNWQFTGTVPLDRKIGSEFGCTGLGLTGSSAHCNITEQGSSRSIADWQSNPVDAWSLLPQGEDAADPNAPAEVNAEKRTLYNIAHYFYTYAGPGPRDNYNQTPVYTLPFRCDITRSGSPSYARTSDCIFHGVTPSLGLQISDPNVTESAQFIYDAQNNITLTYPGIPGKYVPGHQGKTDPITRLYYDQKLRDANRRTSVASCVAKWGANYTTRPDGQTNDCDEYPFASTYQGSFTVTDNMLRSYAVRPVLSRHNRQVGSRLSTFLAENHVLDGDPYYVTVTP